ncbi:uncharacterized protein LOC107475809 [Arachis duranensis]|uniref:Uncharacterized protein LOC107475809 n=1 Tax=Arachis duranensis TaxID=130453 RepID=A0A6P4CHB2_ARADU|nr:uncharacterized protein LOC107475809 [Arachis duranensis]
MGIEILNPFIFRLWCVETIIEYVRDESWSTDPDILQEEALSFYKNLFGITEDVKVDCLGNVLIPTLSTEACDMLIDPVSFAEVKSSVFSVSPFKALDIVSPLQGGFIPSRGAPDNIIVAQKILNFMKHTKSKKGTLAFKIDLQKAYDRVDWRFLESTLITFGFPIITVNLIMNCVRASSLSIMWNGNRLDSFSPKKGLRQGDPIYLGVNLNHFRTSRASFHSVIENVRGRFCLINSVAASIPVFHVQVSFFPNWVCDKLSSMMRQFLWKGHVDDIGLFLVNWRTVITPKKFGGLSVRDPACVNIYLLGELVWQLFHCQDKPWVALLRAKYLRNDGVLDGPVHCNASHVWKSISKAFGALKDAFSWCVGSLDQFFWSDNLSIEGPIAQDAPFVHISNSDLTIKDVWKDGQWNLHDVFSNIPKDVKQRLNAYNLNLNVGESLGWSWGVASSRLYLARSGYSWCNILISLTLTSRRKAKVNQRL